MPRAPSIDLGPRYRPLRELGRGGMGTVFLVEDLERKKELALKLLHGLAAASEAVQDLEREFTLLCELEHPGFARVYDFGFLGERPYFTREYIPGRSLEKVKRVGNPRHLLRIARDLTEAVACLHRNGVLHLDIKPGNVIL